MLDYNFSNNLAKRNTDINEYLLILYGIAVGMDAKTIVELGAGQSTYVLTAAANKTDGQFYSIDVCEGAREREFEGNGYLLDKEDRYHFILGDDMEIVKTWNKKIDFLFLDTSHVLEHTRKELSVWPDFIRSGGVLFMHDTAHETGDGMGCRQALNEFMNSEKGKQYRAFHMLDTKHIGMSLIIKL